MLLEVGVVSMGGGGESQALQSHRASPASCLPTATCVFSACPGQVCTPPGRTRRKKNTVNYGERR